MRCAHHLLSVHVWHVLFSRLLRHAGISLELFACPLDASCSHPFVSVARCVAQYRVNKLESMNVRFTALSDAYAAPAGASASSVVN